MKLLYCYSQTNKGQDIMWGFIELGVEMTMHNKVIDAFACDEKLIMEALEIEQTIKGEKCDGVLSWNYLPAASIACDRVGVPYISWIFDSPLVHVYSKTMLNSCNYIFVFDKLFYRDILSKGGNAYYLPLAVNSTRIGAMNITDEQIARFSEEVSFVGSLYTKNPYNEALPLLSKNAIQEYEKLFNKQYGNWKDNYLYTDISNEEMARMEQLVPIRGIEDYPYISKGDTYIGFVLARKMAEYERKGMLNELAKHFNVTLYNSKEDKSELFNVACKPSVEYEYETPIVYYSSKINLNMTLRSIQSGLPLRVFDIMGVGGFLMSNYQKEFEELYVPDKEVVLYSSIDELVDKTRYYLNHERERLTIAMNGYKRTISEHTMKRRAASILRIVFGF